MHDHAASGAPIEASVGIRIADLYALEVLLTAAVGIGDEVEGARLVVTGLPSILACEFAAIALDSDNGWRLISHRVRGDIHAEEESEIEAELSALRDRSVQAGRLILKAANTTLPAAFQPLGLDSLAVLPIRTVTGCIGILMVGAVDPHAESLAGLEDPLLATIAAPLALGIENVRLRRSLESTVAQRTEQLERRAEELDQSREAERRLLELTNAIIGTTDRADLFDAISEALGGFVACERSALLLYREETDHLEVYALGGPMASSLDSVGHTIPRDESFAWRALEERRPILVDDMGDDPRTDAQHQLVAEGVRSLLVVPLISKDRVLGLLAVVTETRAAYTDADAERLSRVAAQVAVVVEKMLSFEEISRLKAQLERENLYLREEIRTEHDFEEIIGESPALLEVLSAVETVAPTDASVLISGETGTGKELVARALHDRSKRSRRPFVKINCAAIPEGLVESELFGHEKGAFTGALSRKMGRFQLADHGTIFLDEIGELPFDLQSKLLRILQEGEFERLGSVETRTVDVRVVAATNRDLDVAVAEGSFRSDLFYRLNVFPIEVPALRERGNDVEHLVSYFARRFSQKFDRSVDTISRATMERLSAYRWPGNVRELRNVVERAVILSQGDSLELGPWFQAAGAEIPGSKPMKLDDVQRKHILEVLKLTGWKVSGTGGAAKLLDVKPTTLDHRMKKLGIRRDQH